MTDTIIQNLVTFELGDLPEDHIVLLLGYATSQEALSRREIQSFVIGMSRDRAAQLLPANIGILPAEKFPAI